MAITAEELNALVIEKLIGLGFTVDSGGNLTTPTDQSKFEVRGLHEPSRLLELRRHQIWLKGKIQHYEEYFANGSDLDPHSITPNLVEVTESWHSDLFRIARLYWSLPYSKGYGRRLRYLLFDEHNGKLMGILSLQSPPLSFPARDQLFQYPEGKKIELINQTMDIHTLGAIPPYSRLLGGKLVAYAAVSNEVREAYARKYNGRPTEMTQRVLPANLVALTTTSAFGRSSIYNRLKYNSDNIAQSLGFTKGYGSFHLMELYPRFREYLEDQGISTRGGFGTGPRIKWQTMVRALERIGLSKELLRHGVEREAFLFPLIENLKDYLEGRSHIPQFKNLPFKKLSQFWHSRWLIPRSERVDGWHRWKFSQFKDHLLFDPGQDECDDNE